MKKVLLGTSAIALAGAFANSAHAVEWNVRVGGYMEQYAAYADSDVDGIDADGYDGFDPGKTEAEVHFVPSVTLDNGMKIGADIQLEGLDTSGGGDPGSGDQIDESFLFIDGSFGRVLLGSENSAGYLMSYGAPDVTFLNVNSGSLPSFIPFTGSAVGTLPAGGVATVGTGSDFFRGTLGSTLLENARNNDAQRITYFTPRFAGFQVGLSYARDGLQDNSSQQNIDVGPAQNLNNIFDVGANYVNTFGAVDVAVSGRWGIASNDANDVFLDTDGDGISEVFDFEDNPQVWAAGLNLGFGGVTVGGSFGEQNNAGAMDGRSWDAGIAYETGPWGVSFTYFNGENVDNDNYNALTGVSGGDEQAQQYLLGASYTVAQGVALNGFGAYVDFDEDCGDAGCGAGAFNAGGDDVDGWVVGTGIKISW